MSAQPQRRHGSYCPNKAMIVLADGKGREFATWMPCDSWVCPCCGKRMAANWHAVMLDTLTAVQEGGTQLYRWTGLRSTWESRVQRRVRRAKGSAYRVTIGEQTTVITNRCIAGSVPVLVDAAFLHGLLAGIPRKKGRPIAACGGWPAPQHQAEPKGEWKVIGAGRTKPATMRQVLQEFELDFREKSALGDFLFTWTIPGHWSADQLSIFRAASKRSRAVPASSRVHAIPIQPSGELGSFGFTLTDHEEAARHGWTLSNAEEAECWEMEKEAMRRRQTA